MNSGDLRISVRIVALVAMVGMLGLPPFPHGARELGRMQRTYIQVPDFQVAARVRGSANETSYDAANVIVAKSNPAAAEAWQES